MTSLAVQSALEVNLAALGRSNADVVQLLRQTPPAIDVTFTSTQQQVLAGLLDGQQMCSRHKPLDEAQRLVESIDLVEHAVIVVLGFAMGYHVQQLAQRMGKAGVIVVYEPDVAVARAVLDRVDHSSWIKQTNLIWITSETDRATLGARFRGVESILAQGVTFVEHAASRDRLGERSGAFSRMFRQFTESAGTVLMTQLVKATDAVRNMVLNVDHYVSCDGIADLKGTASGFPAVVVSAGPSLRKNMHLLAQPGVRERVVIIAVQTVLKPLLRAGIRPHFVTALDYHEISARFYEGLTTDDVRGITLVAEAKVHPAVLDAFPGRIRCVGAKFLDDLLGGEIKRDMGELPAGTTVAHLAAYFAQYLGCNTIAMIGQDLGFTDGLYYGPGTAIDDVWSPELNAFNTIEMMQWQRIVRHREHLSKLTDVHGRSIYTDAQMAAYLQQFERDFAAFQAQGIEVIDASEGGVAKQHTSTMPLSQVLSTHATRPLPAMIASESASPASPSQSTIAAANKRLAYIRREIAELRETSRRTHRLLESMSDDQHDKPKMQQHFAKLKRFQQRVARQAEAFGVLEYLNQLGSFNRRKADRRLHMQHQLSPMDRQKLELQRDAENVAWIQQAATELIDHLTQAQRLLEPCARGDSPSTVVDQRDDRQNKAVNTDHRMAALIPIDPHRDGLGIERSLADDFHGRSVLQATLERLAASRTLERIILIVPRSFDVQPLLDRSKLALPVDIEHCDDDSPFGPEQRAIAAARAFCDTSWRGGIGNMSIYDELLCPQIMHDIMSRRGLTAALLTGPDWPLIDVTSEHGCDALVQRYIEQHANHPLVFTQSPPGHCGCIISAALMKQLCNRNRLATIGSVLGYQPHAPRPDAIGTDACLPIDHELRGSTMRSTYPRLSTDALHAPHHLVLEINADRVSTGLFQQRLLEAAGEAHQPSCMTVATASTIFQEQVASGVRVLTLAGRGDPLLHPSFDQIIHAAKSRNVRSVHVRTELLVERDALDRLLASGVDVISVDLHADTPATYQTMMGSDRFGEVLENIHYLLEHRTRLTDHTSTAAIALPWLVMRLQRCAETYGDLESFFDRWQHVLGTAVIEAGPNGIIENDTLDAAITPERVVQRQMCERIVILSDGSRCSADKARLFLP